MSDRPVYESITLEREGGVCRLTLARPDTLNALTHAMMVEIGDAVDRIARDQTCRIVVLRGAGGNFCAGGDINAMKSIPPPPRPGEEDPLYAPYRLFGDVLQALDGLPQAVVALVEGAAVGGGLGMVCCADAVIVRADAKFGIPEPRAGFIPSQMIPFLIRRVGPGRARHLAVTSDRIDGREAHRIGLADRCCEDAASLEAALAETLTSILGSAPGAVATVKRLIVESEGRPLEEILDAAGKALVERLRSPDAAEGMAAFLEKRTAQFKHR